MSTTTWTKTWTEAPADLLGLGGYDARRCTELDGRTRIGVSPAPRVAQFQGTGVPAAGMPFAHNSIGTTLGIHPSRRPQS
jgi:hypothetical protein